MGDTRVASDSRLLARQLGKLPGLQLRPMLIVVSGLPGTGKSHFCRQLAKRVPFLVLESDALRKILLPVPSYSPQESTRLFHAIHYLIEDLLKKSIPLILDATNLLERHRRALYNIAGRLDAKLILVLVVAPPVLVHERLKARANQKNPDVKSDADWSVYLSLKPTVERMRRKHFTVDTSKDISEALDNIVREINRL